jgi:hypothetical protein
MNSTFHTVLKDQEKLHMSLKHQMVELRNSSQEQVQEKLLLQLKSPIIKTHFTPMVHSLPLLHQYQIKLNY